MSFLAVATVSRRNEAMLRRSILTLFAIAAFVLVGSTTWAGKGGNKGKPGGGGGGPAADPAVAYVETSTLAGGTLWVMNPDGSNKERVYDGAARAPGFSPDGAQIAFFSDDAGAGLYNLDVSTLQVTEVASIIGSFPTGVAGCAWSAHGWIALADDESASSTLNDVFVVRPDGSGMTNLSSSPNRGEYFPAWNASGTKLAVQTTSVDGDDSVLIYDIQLVDGKPTKIGETDVTGTVGSPLTGLFLASPDFATKSNRLVLSVALPGEQRRSLWIIDLDDLANPRRLTTEAEDEVQPRWCEGDTRIVFKSPYRNQSALWSIDAVSGQDRQLLGSKRQPQTDPACRR
jgi:Tol biopolymer transport system component